MLEPCLVMRGGSLPRLLLGVSIRIHESTVYAANRFVEPLDPTAGHWRCGASNLIARGWLRVAFAHGNLMSKLKVLDGKSQTKLNCRDLDNWRHSEQNDAGALRDEMADEQREGLAHAIVYPTETKPTGAFKKQSLTCGSADAFDQALIDFAVRTFGQIDVLFGWTTKGDEP